MSTVSELEEGYLLHRRPYRDTSAILDVFTRDHGRIALVARGIRRNRSKQHLQSFVSLHLSWAGRSELLTLKNLEASGQPVFLQGDYLKCGFYINELLYRLLPKHDACSDTYQLYAQVLNHLAEKQPLQPLLRRFEYKLLQTLGYGFSLNQDADSKETVVKGTHYRFVPHHGLVKVPNPLNNQNLFEGAALLGIADQAYEQPHCAQAAKRLFRLALASLLGHRPLQSRQLFYKPDRHCED